MYVLTYTTVVDFARNWSSTIMPTSFISFPSLLGKSIAFAAGLNVEMQYTINFLTCSLCKYATIPKNTITGKMSNAKDIPIVVLVGKPWYVSIISNVMIKLIIKSTKLSNIFSI